MQIKPILIATTSPVCLMAVLVASPQSKKAASLPLASTVKLLSGTWNSKMLKVQHEVSNSFRETRNHHLRVRHSAAEPRFMPNNPWWWPDRNQFSFHRQAKRNFVHPHSLTWICNMQHLHCIQTSRVMSSWWASRTNKTSSNCQCWTVVNSCRSKSRYRWWIHRHWLEASLWHSLK